MCIHLICQENVQYYPLGSIVHTIQHDQYGFNSLFNECLIGLESLNMELKFN